VLRRCVWSRNIKNGCSIYIYIYIYDISRLRVKWPRPLCVQLALYWNPQWVRRRGSRETPERGLQKNKQEEAKERGQSLRETKRLAKDWEGRQYFTAALQTTTGIDDDDDDDDDFRFAPAKIIPPDKPTNKATLLVPSGALQWNVFLISFISF